MGQARVEFLVSVGASVLAALLLAGCASTPDRVLSEKAPSYAALPNGHDPLNPSQLSPNYAALTSGADENATRYLERKRGHALNILSLSGGGLNGAFGAGFLIGWRDSTAKVSAASTSRGASVMSLSGSWFETPVNGRTVAPAAAGWLRAWGAWDDIWLLRY